MLYLKTKLNEDITLTVPIHDDEIYSQCPGCGVEHHIESEVLAHVLNEGGDFSSTSIFCGKCSEKGVNTP